MHTSYPYQTVRLGRLRTEYPFQTLTLGATGEGIDAVTPPEKGEKLWYERTLQGQFVGTVVGAGLGAAFVLSKSAPRDHVARAFAGAAFPLIGMFVGGVVRRMMPRGVITPA